MRRAKSAPVTFSPGATQVEDIGEVYVVEDTLGAGRFSKVYRGIHVRSSQQHALKVISVDKMKETCPIWLKHETDMLRCTNHPSIVKWVECYETKDEVVIAMELLEGEELTEVINREDRMSDARSAHVLQQIAAGLAHFKQLGIAHRDLKPANLKFADKENTVLKIIDLGGVPTMHNALCLSLLHVCVMHWACPELSNSYRQQEWRRS